MVQDLVQEQEKYRERLNRFRGMTDHRPRHGHTQSLILEKNTNDEFDTSERQMPVSNGASEIEALEKDMEMMKEKFSKLLLGEDMSGGGKGVSSALALSNAITNLAASVFGEHRKLEPMAPENKARWRKEIDWLLSVTDHIVEFVPSQQKSANGTSMEIMTTKQRDDLLVNIPALRKLDAMLIDCLDKFIKDKHEFYYVSKDAKDSERSSMRDDKWWLPSVKVPTNGLSEVTRKWLQFQKDSVNQVLKAAMAINAEVISLMEIPENYIESLPKNGRATLGDAIYKSITADYFDPAEFLSTMDLSSDHKIVDLINRIEASVVIWKRKMTHKDGKSTWGSSVSLEKREIFEERAETILVIIKQQFPGLPQSSLDISKIQFSKDVGHAILESYSRVLESLAHKVLSGIEDVLYADSLAQNPALARRKKNPLMGIAKITSLKFPNADEEIEKLNATEIALSMTLSDFMGWNVDHAELDSIVKEIGESYDQETNKDGELKVLKLPNIMVPKKPSYLENLGGLRSPTARH